MKLSGWPSRCMPPTDDERLVHMRDFGRGAIALVAGKSPEEVMQDRVLSLALTYLVETIGEAASHISRGRQASIPDIPWRDIVNARNRIIHGYDLLDIEIVDTIVRTDLPPLVSALERALPGER